MCICTYIYIYMYTYLSLYHIYIHIHIHIALCTREVASMTDASCDRLYLGGTTCLTLLVCCGLACFVCVSVVSRIPILCCTIRHC